MKRPRKPEPAAPTVSTVVEVEPVRFVPVLVWEYVGGRWFKRDAT